MEPLHTLSSAGLHGLARIVTKTTLVHTDGTTSQPGAAGKPMVAGELGGHAAASVTKAIINCFGIKREQDGAERHVELLRADIAGDDWVLLGQLGMLHELDEQMRKTAPHGGLDDVHLVFEVDGQMRVGNARLVFGIDALRVELMLSMASSIKSLVSSIQLPSILPYQIGGDADGAHVLLFCAHDAPVVQAHSIHPTAREASVAQAALERAGVRQHMVLRVTTPVTQLLAIAKKLLSDRLSLGADTVERSAASPEADPAAPAALRSAKGARPT